MEKEFDDGKGDSGIEYQFKIIVYIAGCLSKKNVQDYWIYTNRELPVFDDMIVKYTDGRQYFIYFCQIKYKTKNKYLKIDYRGGNNKDNKNLINIQKYLEEIRTIMGKIHNITNENQGDKILKELFEGVPESNIEFWLFSNSSFSERPKCNPLKDAIELDRVKCCLQPHTDNHPIVPVGKNGTTYYKFIPDKNEQQQRPSDLEKFYVFLNQPDNKDVASSIGNLNIDLLTDKPAQDMINFVTEYLKKATSVTMLRKNIFETHLLSVCLTNFIVQPTEAFVMKPELAQAWNRLVTQFDVTLTSSETKPYLYGCLSQKIREHFGDFDWNKIISGSYLIPEAEGIKEKLKEHFKNTEMEYWLGKCGTIQDLLKTLWECGYLPLVLNGNFNVSILNNYRHLGNKRFVLLADNGISNLGLRVFASAADIHGIKLGKDFLNSILISMQGREPVQLSSILNGDIDLMKELKCEQLLYLIRERDDLLRSVESSATSKIITENGNYFYIKKVDGGKQVVPIIAKCFQDTENYLKRHLSQPTVKKTIRDSERKVICLLTGDLNSIDWSKSNYYNLPDESVDDIISRVETQTEQNEAAFIGTKDEHVEGLWSQFSSTQYPFLHIKVERGTMILLKYRNCRDISSHVSFNGPKFNAETFFEETSTGITVITGEPGSGKSTLLRSLFNACDKHSFALFCDLKNYREDLRDDKSDLFNDPINFILRKEEAQLTLSNEQYSNRHLNFLRKFFEKTKEMILFLDSFDEVLPEYEEQVLELIGELNKSNRRCIIASRLDTAYILGEHFEVTPLKIDTLSKGDIEEYLSKELPDNSLNEYPSEFRENPLFLGFLIKLKREKALPDDITSSSLYNAIIDQSIKHLFHEKYNQSIRKRKYGEWRKVYLKIYKELALLEIFNATVIAELKVNYTKLQKEYKFSEKSKLGLIVQFNERGPVFLHRTIAEFLVAEWVIENIDEDRGKSIYAILLKDHWRHTRHLLDDILCRNLALHQAIIQKDLPKVKSLCSAGDKYLREVDKLNRSALDVAAIYCSDYTIGHLNCLILEEIVQQVISKEINSFERNSLTNFQWTDYLSGEYKQYFLNYAIRLKLARTAEMYFYCKNEIIGGITWCIENEMLDTAMVLLKKDISLPDSCFSDFLLKVVPAMRMDLLFELIEFKSSTSPEFDKLCRACRKVLPITEVSKLANLKMEDWGFTAIHIACMSGSTDVVRELISLEVDVNAVDAFGFHPFYYAIETCSTEILTILAKSFKNEANILDKWGRRAFPNYLHRCIGKKYLEILAILAKSFKREANIKDKWGRRVFPNYLHRCIRKNYWEIAEILLLVEGFNKDEKDEDGRTALHIVVENCREKYTILRNGETDIPKPDVDDRDINRIKFLLEHKLNVDARDDHGKTPLRIAIDYNGTDIIEMLLRHGANPNIGIDFYGHTPLYIAIKNRNHKAVTLLLKYGADVKQVDSRGRTALFAPFRDDYDKIESLSFINYIDYFSSIQHILKALVKAGADVNNQNNDGWTALMIAAYGHCSKIATILLESGAKVNLQNKDGNTALHLAVRARFANNIIAEALVKKGANVNHQNNDGETALMIAAYGRLYEITTMLLENGADVNLQDKRGNTALHKAVSRGSANDAEALVNMGANVNQQNNDGDTALMIAIYEELYEITTMLLENGAEVNLKNKHGNTALHEAVSGHSVEYYPVAEALVKKGVNVNHQNNDGETALIRAVNKNMYKIATMLLENGADVNLHNKHGNTALHEAVWACFYQFYRTRDVFSYDKLLGMSKDRDKQLLLLSDMEIIEMLLKGDTDNRDKIEDARARRVADLLKILIDKGANVDAVNGKGRTALDIAIKYKTFISHGKQAAGSSDGDDNWMKWAN